MKLPNQKVAQNCPAQSGLVDLKVAIWTVDRLKPVRIQIWLDLCQAVSEVSPNQNLTT